MKYNDCETLTLLMTRYLEMVHPTLEKKGDFKHQAMTRLALLADRFASSLSKECSNIKTHEEFEALKTKKPIEPPEIEKRAFPY